MCPRCGEMGYLEIKTVNERTYYYCRHPINDGGRRRFTKCYLGPKQYRYVEMANNLGLSGFIDNERHLRYLTSIIDSLPEEALRDVAIYVMRRLAPKHPYLQEAINRLRGADAR